MARERLTFNPVTRVNGFLEVEVEVADGRVVEARCSGVHFRGFELILRGRDPRDVSYFTERICGICSSAHALAAALAVEEAAGVVLTRNAILVRNIIFGADIIQNHLRHHALLALPDFLNMPARPPFLPAGHPRPLPPKLNEVLLEDWREGVELSRLAHEAVAIFGGKIPHQHGIIPGGATSLPTADRVRRVEAIIKKIHHALVTRHLPHFEDLAAVYPEYATLGRGYGNFLNYGMFPKTEERDAYFFPPGQAVDGSAPQPLDLGQIREDIRHSWYAGEEALPPRQGVTEPDFGKEGAYSWVKAPRYAGRAYEGGPLARLWLAGEYRRGISVLDRLRARLLETRKICELILEWLRLTRPDKPVFTPFALPREGEGVGLTGAMRGPLGHWLRIEGGRIAHYQVITPSAWNFSPRDAQGRRGPVEEALIGTPVRDLEEAVEVGRVVRSFDPCLACATHLIDVHRRLEVEYVLDL